MNCKTPGCPHPAGNLTGYRFLSKNFFGPRGSQLTEGYCLDCASLRMKQAGFGLLLLICLVAGVVALTL
jgi:hypothetical protein